MENIPVIRSDQIIHCAYFRKYQQAYKAWLENPETDGIMPTADGLFIVAPRKDLVGLVPEELRRA